MPKYRIGVLYDVWWVDEPGGDTEAKPRKRAARKKEKETHHEVY